MQDLKNMFVENRTMDINTMQLAEIGSLTRYWINNTFSGSPRCSYTSCLDAIHRWKASDLTRARSRVEFDNIWSIWCITSLVLILKANDLQDKCSLDFIVKQRQLYSSIKDNKLQLYATAYDNLGM